MRYLEPIVALLKLIGSAFGLFMVRKSGKDAERLKNAENEIEAIDEAKVARDSLDADPGKRDRLRDEFR